MFGLSEFAVVLVVVIIVLAVKKGPDLVRSAGRSARALKAEEKGAGDAAAPRVVPGETVGPARGAADPRG
ncbi:sec-independent protein translocase protein TatA [Streptomyces aurantiacus]|uniref:twin-arginine translocase TatA/TatE family subunit n=1 Tax=Streptomyces aurantiacus TaxID=47760 RepID=UPI00278F7774|nr:twin-arginine translocase TatA/TatE family subunit [Streptomyces aurantiacus]MDQ0776078.1 sec-independent protein translocase protein TatA [Streptomyces aurantiacus]